MIPYIAILEKEPGSLWGLWFPDLAGCVTAGETAEATLEQAPDALRLWLEGAMEEGAEPPVARDLDALREDPEVAAALAAGQAAVVVSVGEEAVLDDTVLSAIDAAAGRIGLSRQGFIRQALLDKVAS